MVTVADRQGALRRSCGDARLRWRDPCSDGVDE